MTRWTFFLLLPWYFLRSMEFNGDMYPEGYGDTAFDLLCDVRDAESFETIIRAFNAQAHKYRDDTMCFRGDMHEMRRHIDMTKGSYYDFWFSDWIFIKNLSGRNFPLVIKRPWSSESSAFLLGCDETARIHFGELYGSR